MFFKSKSVLMALFAITVCVAQSAFGADETNETLMPKGMWKDPDTGLIWMRCSLGQTWNGQGCDGEAKNYKWWDAIKTIDQLTFGGQSDWRVPTASELASLMAGNVLRGKTAYSELYNGKGNYGKADWNELNKILQNDNEKNRFYSSAMGYKTSDIFKPYANFFGLYWSSSPYVYSSGKAWVVYFYDGHTDYSSYLVDNYTILPYQVRAVRSSRPLGGKALLIFSELAKKASDEEEAFKKENMQTAMAKAKQDAIEAKQREKQERIDAANRAQQDQQACSRLYIGKAVKVRLCNALFGCTNFSAEIVGIGNGNATAKLTADGGLYGERRELRCDQF